MKIRATELENTEKTSRRDWLCRVQLLASRVKLPDENKLYRTLSAG